MRKVNTNISLDPKLKKDAVKLFKRLGMDLSTAISIFLFQSIRVNGIPFEIYDIPNKKTVKAVRQSNKMMKHPEKSKTYSSVKELLDDM